MILRNFIYRLLFWRYAAMHSKDFPKIQVFLGLGVMFQEWHSYSDERLRFEVELGKPRIYIPSTLDREWELRRSIPSQEDCPF